MPQNMQLCSSKQHPPQTKQTTTQTSTSKMDNKQKAAEMAQAVRFCRSKGLLTSSETSLMDNPQQADRQALEMLGYKAILRQQLWEQRNREQQQKENWLLI